MKEFDYELSFPDIKKIFDSILDKLDKIPSSDRDRKIKIKVSEKFLPSLYYPKDFDDDKKLVSILKIFLEKKIFFLEEKKRDTYMPFSQKENASLVFNYEFEDFIRAFYNRKIIQDDWFEIVEACDVNEKIKDIILRNKIEIIGKNNQEICDRMVKLFTQNNKKKSIRHVSAKYFWGLSKMLDNKAEIIEFLSLKPSPIILHVKSFCDDFKNILFIENLDTFSTIIESKNHVFNNFLIIYSSGFKASAKRMRTVNGSKIFFEYNCTLKDKGRDSLARWLYGNEKKYNVYFWGDMDYSGINIYNSMKEIFSEIKLWKLGYSELLKAIDNDNFHNPIESHKESQIKPLKTNDFYIDEVLLPKLEKGVFIDQEYVDISCL